jgi:hypothetical protein
MRPKLVVAYLALCAAAALAALVLTNSATPGGGRASSASAPRVGREAASRPATTRAAVAGITATRGTSTTVAMMTPATFDPARIRMKINAFQVNPPKVNAKCTGTVVIVNTGPGYEHDANQVLPYWMLTIADAEGAEIHMGGGGWSGPMRTDEFRTFIFDTHSNSVADAQGRPFLFPKVGTYTVTVSVFPGGNLLTPVDTKTVTVDVPTPK